jgi:hypothetical protein
MATSSITASALGKHAGNDLLVYNKVAHDPPIDELRMEVRLCNRAA